MKIITYEVEVKDVLKSPNIKQGISVYLERLNKILPKIVNGCTVFYDGSNPGFRDCDICQADYSVQFLDIAICILYEDGIIDKETKENIMGKLYDGHRG